MRRASDAKFTLSPGPRLALFFCAAFACLFSMAWGGEVRVVEGNSHDHVVIEASDANADEVLAVLAAYFQFAVERSARPAQPVRFSGRLQGSLDQLLERILRHEGHIIVRSAEAQAGISRVLLFEAKGGAPASGVVDALAALKAKLQLKQPLQSGEPGK